MGLEPSLCLLPLMNTDIVTNQVNERDLRRCLLVDLFEQLNEFYLPFAATTDPDDLAAACIKGRQQV